MRQLLLDTGCLSTVEVPALVAFLNWPMCIWIVRSFQLGFHEFLRTLLKNQEECLE
jgi:hypothetical protein